MKTVSEVAKLFGVSVRTLHHYDAIKLVTPTAKTEAGYRLYDESALARLQTVLLFKELGFSLHEIAEMVQNPNFDCHEALLDQIKLLKRQKRKLDGLITLAETYYQKGEIAMSNPWNEGDLEKAKREAKEKWGNTAAYRDYEKKNKTEAEEKTDANALMLRFAHLGGLKHLPPESEPVQAEIKALGDFITAHYYPCTKEILASLGQLYVGDERFKANIDAVGGSGTADFVSQAIAVYCR